MKKVEGLVENLVGHELFISSPAGDELLVLNRSALFVWSMVEDHETQEMLSVLGRLFPDAGEDRLVADIHDSVKAFREAHLLRD
jgi:hypothetical protein